MTPRSSAIYKILLLGWLAMLAACGQPGGQGATQANDARNKELTALAAKREAKIRQLHAMDVTGLANELVSDSTKGLEPFNSMAYAEMVARGKQAAPTLQHLLSKPDRTSLLGLLALRQLDSNTYRAIPVSDRVAILTDALKNSRFFNTWGIPTAYWTDAAKAIIDEGKAAEPALLVLTRDTRPAPVWGSEGAYISQKYHFRVADYAWALIAEIRHQRIEIPENPAERDKLIAAMQKQSRRSKK